MNCSLFCCRILLRASIPFYFQSKRYEQSSTSSTVANCFAAPAAPSASSHYALHRYTFLEYTLVKQMLQTLHSWQWASSSPQSALAFPQLTFVELLFRWLFDINTNPQTRAATEAAPQISTHKTSPMSSRAHEELKRRHSPVCMATNMPRRELLQVNRTPKHLLPKGRQSLHNERFQSSSNCLPESSTVDRRFELFRPS